MTDELPLFAQDTIGAEGGDALAARAADKARIADLEAQLAALSADLERSPDQRRSFVLPRDAETFWKDAIGGVYTPASNSKQVAAHPATIRRIMAGPKDARTDAIAALIHSLVVNLHRERSLLTYASERQAAADARIALLEQVLADEGLVVDGAPNAAVSMSTCNPAVGKLSP